jgi:hypothetical protein
MRRFGDPTECLTARQMTKTTFYPAGRRLHTGFSGSKQLAPHQRLCATLSGCSTELKPVMTPGKQPYRPQHWQGAPMYSGYGSTHGPAVEVQIQADLLCGSALPGTGVEMGGVAVMRLAFVTTCACADTEPSVRKIAHVARTA